MSWWTLIFGGTATLFLGMTLSALWHMRWVRRLPSLASLTAAQPSLAPAGAGRVQCSVVIAARDEEARIEQTLRRLFAQTGVDIEIIVVDDRSIDRTGEILRRLAKDDERLKIKRVDTLPVGWLGKCNACHVGAAAASGEWILFTDADCWLKPDVLARAILQANRDGADHVTMAPGTVLESPWTQGWHLLFLTSLLGWFSGVNRDRPKSYVGIGAFNLVRAEAYRLCGGYEALRLTVVDDVKLGLLLRRAGKRTRAFLGVDDVECHWGATVGSMIRIMEKNYFAVTDYRLGLVVGGVLVALSVFVVVLGGLVVGSLAGLAAGLSPLSMILPGWFLTRRLGWSWPSAFCLPFMFPVFFFALINSTYVTLRQGGIRWRDTFYPLALLRAGTVR